MENIYYILTVNKVDLPSLVAAMSDENKSKFVQDTNTIRWNNTNTKCIVKLRLGVDKVPNEIAHLDGVSHSEILIEIQNSEWNNDI